MRLLLIVLGVLAFFGIVLFEPVLQTYGGATEGDFQLLILIPIVLILIPVVMTLAKWFKAASRKQRDAADGVIAAWDDARITPTEFIDGYKPNAARYSLVGLAAATGTSGELTTFTVIPADGIGGATMHNDSRRLHLAVRGPHTNRVYTVKRPGLRATLRARKFAETLNATSLQLQARSAPPQPAPGWYPNPTGKPGQSYWDGQGWQNAT